MSFTSRESLWRNRDLRIAVAARAASLLGDEVALVALILRLHDEGASAAHVAALLAAGMLPIVLLAPVVGVVVDRYDSRRLLVGTSLAQAAVCLALAAVEGHAALLGLAALLGTGQAVNSATWLALVPRIVGNERVAEAMGLMQAAFTLVGIGAPALGGLMSGLYGTRVVLLLAAASFLSVTIAALLVETRRARAAPGASARARDGIAFVRRDPVVAPLVAALAAFVVFGMMVNVVEVFLVRDTLSASATWYGVLGATWAGGIVIGSVSAGRLSTTHARVIGACVAAPLMSLAFLGFAAAPDVIALLPITVAGGTANGILNVCAVAVVMTRAPDEIRGRVAAAIGAVFSAGSVTSLVAGGILGQALTPRQVFAVSGVLALSTAAVCVPRAIRASRDAESRATGLEPASPDVGRGVPARHRGDFDDVAGVRAVDEAAATDVDAVVAQAVEEDQVAGLQLAAVDGGAMAVLGGGVVWEGDAELRVDVHDKA
jgi:MFS family permease